METVREPQPQPNQKKQELLRKIAGDLDFQVFAFLPFLQNFAYDPKWMSEKAHVSEAVALDFSHQLLTAGIWEVTAEGSVKIARDSLNQIARENVINVFKSKTEMINSKLSLTGPCWFQTTTVASTKDLILKYIQTVQKAQRELIEQSNLVAATDLFAVSTSLIDALQVVAQEEV